MADDVAPDAGPTWLTYPELAVCLGLPSAAAAAACASLAKWPKRTRKDTGQTEVEVFPHALSVARRSSSGAPTTLTAVVPEVASDGLWGAMSLLEAQAAELQAARNALDATRAELAYARAEAAAAQAQADALRDQLARAQVYAAQAEGTAGQEREKRAAIEQALRKTQRALMEVKHSASRRPWWRRTL